MDLSKSPPRHPTCTLRTANITPPKSSGRQSRPRLRAAKLITFPELCLTGYTCGDLFLQEMLLEGAMNALGTVCRETAELAGSSS